MPNLLIRLVKENIIIISSAMVKIRHKLLQIYLYSYNKTGMLFYENAIRMNHLYRGVRTEGMRFYILLS